MKNGFYYTSSALMLLSLIGCGGSDGGSASSSSLNVPQTSFSIESNAYDSAYVDVPFSVNINTGDNLYYGIIEDSGSLISNAEYYFDANASGYVSVYFKPGYEIGDGVKSTKALFAVCHDTYCNRHYSGSPVEVNFTNKVTLDQKINLAVPKIEVVANDSDQYVQKNLLDAVNLSGTGLNSLYFQPNENSPIITSVTSYLNGENVNLNITFETPSFVGVGTFNSEFTLAVCYDYSCNYPIEGSPLSIPVSYTINSTTPDPDPNPNPNPDPSPDPDPDNGNPGTPSNGNKVEFDNLPVHNTVDAVYSDALNVIAIVSDYPKAAIYFYSLADSKTYGVDLAKMPSAVTVDNINGTNRFVVGHDAMITTVEYDVSSPIDSQVSQIFTLHDIFDLASNGHYVWTLPKDDQWVDLQVINLESGSVVSVNDWGYYEQTVLKLNPDGKAFYSLDTALSPSDVARTDLSDPANPGNPVDSRYHGDYSFCDNFWFNHTGTFIYTECGVRLNASESSGLDMTYAGTITLPSSGDWGGISPIQSLDESHDGSTVAFAVAGEHNNITILDSLYLNTKETFSLPDTTINNATYTTVPKFVFYGSDNKLNIVGNATVNGIPHTVIIQK